MVAPSAGVATANFTPSGGSCGDAPCSYAYALTCADGQTDSGTPASGPVVSITVGPGEADVSTDGLGGATLVCTVTLTVTDESGRSAATNTTLTIG